MVLQHVDGTRGLAWLHHIVQVVRHHARLRRHPAKHIRQLARQPLRSATQSWLCKWLRLRVPERWLRQPGGQLLGLLTLALLVRVSVERRTSAAVQPTTSVDTHDAPCQRAEQAPEAVGCSAPVRLLPV